VNSHVGAMKMTFYVGQYVFAQIIGKKGKKKKKCYMNSHVGASKMTFYASDPLNIEFRRSLVGGSGIDGFICGKD
jgi:predicted ATP-grasp superfamily ATP-dependent carboligase